MPMQWALLFVLSFTVAACGSAAGVSDDGRPTVVATTTHVADLVREVAGDGVDVVGLVPPGADPHVYEPRPRDVAALPDAKVIFRSGGELDDWLADTLEGAGGEGKVVDLAERVDADPDDPHWWQSPDDARTAVKVIIGTLLDAGVGQGVRERGNAYSERLGDLDAEIRDCLDRLRPDERKLVTTHDSLGYYAQRYDLQIIGAVIPSRSTQGQPSVGETADLVETLRREKVKAIFTEHAVPARVEKAIADEAGTRLGGALWTDSLDKGVDYIQAMRENTAAIAEGLSGGRVRCSTS
jgi:ABC-type Zn uptake system ZnuABC Zn-binding protein ZnuA